MKALAGAVNARLEEMEVSRPDKTGFSRLRKSMEMMVREIQAFEKRAEGERANLLAQLGMFKEFAERTNRRVDELGDGLKRMSKDRNDTTEFVKKGFTELNSQLTSFKGYSLEQIGKINEWIGFIKENLK